MSKAANPFGPIRQSMAEFGPSPKVAPNESINFDRAFFPDGHRAVLDLRRQLVVGNRGMGKSFWTHALLNPDLRARVSKAYDLPALAKSTVAVGFNGSDKLGPVAPSLDEIAEALKNHTNPDLIWKAVLLRAALSLDPKAPKRTFGATLKDLQKSPILYSKVLSETDEMLQKQQRSLTIVFDALDRLAPTWSAIRILTKNLLTRAVGLQSFQRIQAKIFIRTDQFSDSELFRFPDSSKLTNDRIDLTWGPYELYGLLLFEVLRNSNGAKSLRRLAESTRTVPALPVDNKMDTSALIEQEKLIEAIAGTYMGSHRKRGRVYTWVPLHLSDASQNCSPRTFLTAWKSAADHLPHPTDKAVDHLGLIDGVRHASSTRLTELREDYSWIDAALEPLRGQLVPMLKQELFELWADNDVIDKIIGDSADDASNAPLDLFLNDTPDALLKAMTGIAVMEERANGKINVPDIFRVEAQILRKGGVAVPKRR